MDHSTASSRDDDLLVGFIALQLRMLPRTQFLDALRAWSRQRHRAFSDLLVERGYLSEPQRSGVQNILAQHQRLGPSALADWLSGESETRVESATSAPAPRSAAQERYVVRHVHATGGLGIVSLAEDVELQRDVALKEIQEPHVNDRNYRTRFLREARLTGRLEHPGIVPIYGMGTYPNGHPFYVMRFIRGQSLHDAIVAFHGDRSLQKDPSQGELALRRLLSRFVSVCQTMAYAHSQGVIHRDLKPANVMLGDYGETLVVDWGLARELHSSNSESEEDVVVPSPLDGITTRAGQVLGTPAFMSPEQSRGDHEQIGPASDVYALGATLYFLLSGKPPQPVSELAPNRPIASNAIGLPASVPGGLRAICHKAMATQLDQRYATASELAEDVEHWLAGERIGAYREPLHERLARWSRRHRTLVGVGVTTLLVGVVSLALGLWAVHREHEQTQEARDRAERNLHVSEQRLQLARQAVEECFLVAKEHPLLQENRALPIKKILLERALPFYDRFRSESFDDPELIHDHSRNLMKVGFILSELGSNQEAISRYERAGEQLTRLVKAHPDQVEIRVDRIEANLARATLLRRIERWKECHDELSQLRAETEAFVSDHPSDPRIVELSLAVMSEEATLLSLTGQPAQSVELLKRTSALRELLLCRDPNSVHLLSTLASNLHNLANGLQLLHRPQEALSYNRRAQETIRAILTQAPNQATYQTRLATMMISEASILNQSKQPREALSCLEQSTKMLERIVEDHPTIEGGFLLLGQARFDHASTLLKTNAIDASLRKLIQARTILDPLLRRQPENNHGIHLLAMVCSTEGDVYRLRKQDTKAIESYRRSTELHQQLRAKARSSSSTLAELVRVTTYRGSLLNKLHRHDDAYQQLNQALQLFQELSPQLANSPYFVQLRGNAQFQLGLSLAGQNRHAEALEMMKQALTLMDSSQHSVIRFFVTRSTWKLNHLQEARTMACQLAGAEDLPIAHLPELAMILCSCSSLPKERRSLPLPAFEKQTREVENLAMHCLLRAHRGGLFKLRHWVPILRTSPHFNSLRGRPEFREVLIQILRSPQS